MLKHVALKKLIKIKWILEALPEKVSRTYVNVILSRVGEGDVCLGHVTQKGRIVRQDPNQYCIPCVVT